MLVYHRTAERPDLQMWILDSSGALIDFTGYTFTFKLAKRLGGTATFTKTTGITGAAGAGVEPSGTPNVTIQFTAAELDAAEVGKGVWQLRATTGGLDRVYAGDFLLKDVIT